MKKSFHRFSNAAMASDHPESTPDRYTEAEKARRFCLDEQSAPGGRALSIHLRQTASDAFQPTIQSAVADHSSPADDECETRADTDELVDCLKQKLIRTLMFRMAVKRVNFNTCQISIVWYIIKCSTKSYHNFELLQHGHRGKSG